MTDRKRFRSDVLNTDVDKDYGAVVVTKEGVEVAARSHNLSLEYSDTWDNINSAFQRLGAKIRGDEEDHPPLQDGKSSLEVH